MLRFKFDTDLLAGLTRMVAQQHIKNAVILSAFGSVRGYQVHQVSNRDLPSKDLFIKNPTAPADIIGMSGMIMNGRAHPHISSLLRTTPSAAISNRILMFSPSR